MQKIQKHLIEALCGAFLLLFLCWMIGYFANGLYKTTFDLASCWGGVAALGGAGVMALIKFITDSVANSKPGVSPYEDQRNQR